MNSTAALVLGQPLHRDDLARRHPVLLAARRDHRFHDFTTSLVPADSTSGHQTTRPRLASTRPAAPAGQAASEIVGEPLAHEQARAVHPRLHRGQADAQRLGDLGVRQALDVVHHERGR